MEELICGYRPEISKPAVHPGPFPVHAIETVKPPVRVIVVKNIFRPATEREEIFVEFTVPCPLTELLSAIDKKADDYSMSINGAMVEGLSSAMVAPGDCVVLAPAVGGGVVRIIASIAVLAAAILVPAFLALSPLLTSIVGAAIGIGGNLLINLFLGPSVAKQKTVGSSYDPSGPKSLARPGTPVPKGYGTFAWGGNIVSSFVDQEGQDDFLNVLVCYGFGTADIGQILLNGKDIFHIYQNIAVQVRNGTNDQTPIQGFNKIVNGFPQQTRVQCSTGPVVVPGTGTNIQALEVAVKLVGGLIRFDDHGDPKQLTLAYKVEYSVHGANNWQSIISPRNTHDIVTFHPGGAVTFPFWVVVPTDQFQGSGVIYSTDSNVGAHHPGEPWSQSQSATFYNPDGSSFAGSIFLQGEWQQCNPNLNQQAVDDWWGGYRIITAMQNEPFFDTVKIYGLTAGKWDVRVSKYGSAPHDHTIGFGDNTDPHYQQDIWLWNVNEIFFQDFAYPNMILVAIRALATNQLSGANVNVVTTLMHHINVTLPTELAGFADDNPAIVAYDLLVNSVYGAGVQPSQIDVPSWLAWAQFNDQLVPDLANNMIRRHVVGGVFDSESNVWEALQKVATMSRAMIVPIGMKYTVVLDAPAMPVQIFHVGNIKKDSFKETWLALDDRANQVEVEFADAQRNYRTDLPVSVMTPDDINSAVLPKSTRVTLWGCTDRSRAWNWAFQKLLSTKLLLRQVEIQVAVEAIACQAGSVVGVQHDVTQWGFGGRVMPGSTTSVVNIDRTDLPAFAPGVGFTLCVLHPTLLRGQANIGSIVGNKITLSSFTGVLGRRVVKLVAPDGTETKVLNQNNLVMTVSSVANFAFGQTVQLYDQDAIETVLVSAVNGQQVTVAVPFSQPPAPDAPWVYGQSMGAFPAKLFRVSSIKGSGDFERTIELLEYSDGVYNDAAANIVNAIGIPDVQAAVTELTANELYQFGPGNKNPQQSVISVGWRDGRDTSGADIYVRFDSSAWRFMGTVKSSNFTFLATTGDNLTIQVIGYDRFGIYAPWATAPSVTLVVQGANAAPPDVTGFILDSTSAPGSGTAPTASWDAISGVDHYELRYAKLASVSWPDCTVVNAAIAGSATSYVLPSDTVGWYYLKAVNPNGAQSIHPATAEWANVGGVRGIGGRGTGDDGRRPPPRGDGGGVGVVQDLAQIHDNVGLLAGGVSSPLNSQASMLPAPDIPVSFSLTNTSGVVTALLTWAANAVPRPDTTSLAVPSGTATWNNLAAGATYYLYRYADAVTGVMTFVVAPPTVPDTSPNAAHAAQAALDKRIYLKPISFTTPASSGGTGGGSVGPDCPDGEEIVNVKGRGRVKVATVVEGEFVMGKLFKTADYVWRKVIRVQHSYATSWYKVAGHKMSPHHEIWRDGAWTMPYRCGTFVVEDGIRVRLTLDESEYDEQNYVLEGGDQDLVIHNIVLNQS